MARPPIARLPKPQFDSRQARRFIDHILDPAAGCVELRVWKAGWEGTTTIVAKDRYATTLAGFYDDPHSLLCDMSKLDGVSGYVTLNPVSSKLLARCHNQIRQIQRGEGTQDADITRYRWLYIDPDPRRPSGIGATDDERKLALSARDQLLRDEPDMARSAIWGCSGNGGWILVRLPDYEPTEGGLLVQRALVYLAGKYNDGAVKIDT